MAKIWLVFLHYTYKDKRGIFNIVLKNNFSEKPEFYKYAMYKIYNAFDVKPNFYEKRGVK